MLSIGPLQAFATVSINEKVYERYLVTFKPDKVDKNTILNLGGRIQHEYKNLNALSISLPTQALKAIQKNPNVLLIEEDFRVNTSNQTQDWGIRKTNAPESWKAGFTGKGIKVAVVDTGISNHVDLEISGGVSLVSYTKSYADENGHGTHVAGIVGARNNTYGTVGIAPDASLFAVKVMDSTGSGYVSDVIAGIDWSITNKMDIINLSLGTSRHSSMLESIVNKAFNNGILVVAAAGNNGTSDGSGDTVEYPARYASVIAVAATDSANRRGSFSATGSTIEVAAPGVSVLSTHPGNRYASMSGTSMASPYVAGNIALLKEAFPNSNAMEIRKMLQESVIDLGLLGKDNFFGHGLIQAPMSGQSPVQKPVIEEPAPESSPMKTNPGRGTKK